MNPKDEKAAKRAERLKQLQMEDLGSARREFISTSDIKKRENVSLQYLEAGRMSNVRGTEAHRQAEANKEQLSAWSNVYKGIGDTEDLEVLDSLLSGQTHRFQLNAAIRGDNVQSYTQGAGKSKSSSKVAPNPSTHAGKHTGVVPFKNHQPFGTLASTGTSARGKNSEAFPKQPTLARKPSVNTLRGPSSENQKTREKFDSHNQSANKGASGFKRPPPASLRTRRPAPEFVGDICSPASFLAASRSLLNLIPVQTASVASESASNDHSGDKAPSSTKQPPQKKLCTSSGLSEPIHQHADDRKPHQDLSSELFEKYFLPGMTSPSDHTIHEAHDSKASTFQKKPTTSLSDSFHKTNDVKPHPMQPSGLVLKHPTKELATPLNHSVHSPKDDSAADYHTLFHLQAKHPQNGSSTSTVRSSGIFKDEKTTNRQGSQESAAKPPVKVRLPSSSNYTVNGPQDGKGHSTPIPEPVLNPEPNTNPVPSKAVQTSVPKTAPQVSSKGSMKPQREICNAKSTQATQEILLDVNITPSKGSTQNGNGNDSLMSPSFQDLKGLDFATPSQQVQTPKHEQSQPTPARRIDFHVGSTTTKESEPVKSDDQNDIIEVLCQLMESASLSEKQKENLQQCKNELESKITNDPQTPTPAHFGTHGSQVINQSTKNTPTRNKSSALSPAAAAFVPWSSFKDHRSPTRSISSDSSQHAVPVEKEQPTKQPVAKSSLIGDWNLLPGKQGRRERMGDTARKNYSPGQLPIMTSLDTDTMKFEVQPRKPSHRNLTDASEGNSTPTTQTSASKMEPPSSPVTSSIVFRPRRAPSKPVQMANNLQQSIHASSLPEPSWSKENIAPHTC